MIEIVAGLLFVFVVFVIPLRGRWRYQRFRREVATDSSARMRYYRASLPPKFILSGVIVALFFANGRDASGIHLVASGATTLAFMLPILAGVGLGALLVHRRASKPASRVKLAKSIRGFADLLPRSAEERRMWVLISISAGVTEELIYRGFVFCVLAHLAPNASTFTLLVIGGALFGLAHVYQGTKGVVLTGLVGTMLGVVTIEAGLLTAMAFHALIDLRVLLIPSDLHGASPEDELTGPDPVAEI